MKFIQYSFKNYAEHRNYAIKQASNDYILILDGDEVLSEKLLESILKVKRNWVYSGYYTNRLKYYCGELN